MRAWGWAVQYGTALFLALVLGALLGSIPLFKETIPGTGRLTASDIVQFLGYGTALLMLWMGARRAATQIPEDGRGLSFLGRIVVPLTTLIVVSVGYKVLLVLVRPGGHEHLQLGLRAWHNRRGSVAHPRSIPQLIAVNGGLAGCGSSAAGGSSGGLSRMPAVRRNRCRRHQVLWPVRSEPCFSLMPPVPTAADTRAEVLRRLWHGGMMAPRAG